jgi:UDP-N-acetylenolpyruvoylglucosamine reductase
MVLRNVLLGHVTLAHGPSGLEHVAGIPGER